MPHPLFLLPPHPLSQLLDGEAARLPPDVAPLAGYFTDGGVTCDLHPGASGAPTSTTTTPPPAGAGASGLVGWAAALWRYRGLS